MSDDISRRIDDLLSGAIDEQVREQRALNDTMIGVRDGVSRLVGDVAALSARVTESRETSQGLREELPFLVQREVTTAVNSVSGRIDVLETAVGELVASIAGLEDRVGPEVVIDAISQRLETLRAQQEEQSGSVTADAARTAIETAAENIRAQFEEEAVATRAGYEQASGAMNEMVERHHTQISRRLADMKKWTDDLEARMKSLEKSLEANVKLPADVRKQLNELTGSTQDMTDSVLEEIRINADAAASRISASVEGIDVQAEEMNRRFVEMNERIASFQEQVLAYLQVRDVALEERRDQIVTELLADFLAELPDRDRERTVGRLRSVFARRRDRRDADRYRTTGGAAAAPLPRVSPDAVSRVQAEIEREQRLSERPWAERSYAETARPAAPAPRPPAPRPLESFPADAGEFAAEELDSDAFFEGDEPAPAPRQAKRPPSKRPPAKKAAAKKPAAKKPAPKKGRGKAEPERFVLDADAELDIIEGGPAAFEEPGPEAADIGAAAGDLAEAGEIDVIDLDVFAEPVAPEEEEPVPAKRPKPKAAPKAKQPAKRMPAPPRPKSEAKSEDGREPADAAASSEPSAGSAAQEQGQDTLQEALARVQALVDQHRKPGGGRPKRPR